MAAKGTKKTKTTKAPSGVQPINVPYWAPSWGGNRANVPVPGPGYWDFNVPLGYNPDGSPVTAPGINPNLASPAAPTSAAPNVPPYNPQPNPYALGAGRGNAPTAQEYAPTLTTGNVPAGGSYADWQEWNRQMEASDPNWNYYNPYNSQYAWQWNPREPGTLMAGADPRSQEGVPWHEALNIPWSSSYAPEFYKNQELNPLQWLAVSSNGGNMGSRGWRRPGRYYIPDQQVTRAGPNGPITAERPPKPPRRGEDTNPPGNNKNLTIPAWVGPLVSWRT